MNKKLIWIIVILFVIIAVPLGLYYFSKNSSKPAPTASEEDPMNNAQVSPEVDGALTKTYAGTLPCADCSGIETTLSLTQIDENTVEGRYTMSQKFLEREDDAFVTTGDWTTQRGDGQNPDATVIALNPEDSETIEFYLQVDPQHLEKLDSEGNELDSEMNYTLTLQE